VAEKGVHSLGLCRLDIRDLVYFGLLGVEKYVRS
jgi:ribosomal protein S14